MFDTSGVFDAVYQLWDKNKPYVILGIIAIPIILLTYGFAFVATAVAGVIIALVLFGFRDDLERFAKKWEKR